MLLIGSQAVGKYLPTFLDSRNTCDFDFIGTKEEFNQVVHRLLPKVKVLSLEFKENKCIFKFEYKNKFQVIDYSCIDDVKENTIAWSDKQLLSLPVVSTYHKGIWIAGECIHCDVLCISANLALKISHRFKKDSPHFVKTRKDILELMKNEVYVPDFLKDFLKERERITYQNKLPVLNVKKDNFFTDSVPYKYDHDSIHRAVAMLDRPAYTYYIKDGAEVMCDKDKFNSLPNIVKLYGVLEESYVLALERSVIPFNTDPYKAFEMSLIKVCTSITGGWFREFAWINYDEVINLYHASYVTKFKNALDKGDILPYNSLQQIKD